jgi:hypothetical protein
MGSSCNSCGPRHPPEQVLQPVRLVDYWNSGHVYCWLRAWGLPPRAAETLFAAGVNGIQLKNMFYDGLFSGHVTDPAFSHLVAHLTTEEKAVVDRACLYLAARSWDAGTWVRNDEAPPPPVLVFLAPTR